jgi:hypothetical protein
MVVMAQTAFAVDLQKIQNASFRIRAGSLSAPHATLTQ